jgi:hypothetical protein
MVGGRVTVAEGTIDGVGVVLSARGVAVGVDCKRVVAGCRSVWTGSPDRVWLEALQAAASKARHRGKILTRID